MIEITPGGETALHDLGIENANELSAKIGLAVAINKTIGSKRLTQSEAAKRLGVPQPKVSLIKNYKLDGFSVERLMKMLTALGKDVEIRIRKAPRSRAEGRIRVAA